MAERKNRSLEIQTNLERALSLGNEEQFRELLANWVNDMQAQEKEVIADFTPLSLKLTIPPTAATYEIKVEIDTNITPELEEEGTLREIIRGVQAERKAQKLVPQDKISVRISAPEKEKLIIEKNKGILLKQFRAKEIFVEKGDVFSVKIQKI